MKTKDFFFDLPSHLVAQNPPEKRGQSRLMLMDRKTGKLEHRFVRELAAILSGPRFLSGAGEKPLLVFNNTRVRKARVFGVSTESGTRAEFLLLEKHGDLVWKAMTKRAGRLKPGRIFLFDDMTACVLPRVVPDSDGGTVLLQFDGPLTEAWLDIHGHIPLPPYIKRQDTEADAERYQTVYSSPAAWFGPGASAAAPTAGLHFTGELLDELARAGVEAAFVTLHVGPGTFLPVRSERVEDHVMHEECFTVSEESAARVEAARARGRKIIAVGTTSVRTLESAWDSASGRLRRGEGRTSIFIYPGYAFKVIDALFTNFHTPESTLLMLVSAFAERDFILDSYKEAVREGYRFFSYGDACLVY